MIKIIAVGKLKEKASVSLFNEYLKRLNLYTKMEVYEVDDEKTKDNASIVEMEAIKSKEAKRVLEKIKKDDYVILLDLHGIMITSEKFAETIEKLQTNGKSNITFVIGGSLGLGKELLERSDMRIKLSDLTFPHQLVRILLIEQIYRAYTIINHTPYHK